MPERHHQYKKDRMKNGKERPKSGKEHVDRTRGKRREQSAGSEERLKNRPEVDPDVTAKDLDVAVRRELHSLSAGAATAVAQHLVMAQRLLEDDPEQAYEHANAARRMAGRIGVVREAAGIAAYVAGKYAEALSELRAARRMTGSSEYLPLMADSERGLGRPLRALDLAQEATAKELDTQTRIELLIVAAGARRDLGDNQAALVSLQIPELRATTEEPWLARLQYAYADALLAVGRTDDAHEWFERAAAADLYEETDAVDRLATLKEEVTTTSTEDG